MLPPTIPLFPLPNVVLFPNVFLPLHIFEPRYRQMVHQALAADQMIGMVLLRPGYDEEYEGTPPVYEVGCAGTITHVERLPDGRFNIVLKGTERFKIVTENPPHDSVLYREGHVIAVPEELADSDRELLQRQRVELEQTLAPLFTAAHSASRLPEILSDQDLVNALAQYLALEPVEKQALLELAGPVHRARVLLELLEMKALGDFTRPSDRGQVH